MRRIAALVPCLLLLGCGREGGLMPLDEGHALRYVARTSFASTVEPVQVTRRLPVAGVQGAELTGPMGTSRLAWSDGVLYADATANGRFSPPLPLLTEDGKPRTWHGRLETYGRVQPAAATLKQKAGETIRIGTRTFLTTRATLVLELPASKGRIELDSWYQRGIGLVQQEQRTNGARVLQLQWLSGP